MGMPKRDPSAALVVVPQAHVAAAGDLEPAAGAGAADHRDRRMLQVRKRMQRVSDDLAVGFGLISTHALFREFGDIRSRGEMIAHARDQHAAQIVVSFQFRRDLDQPPPGVQVHGIALLGVVDDQGRDGALAFQADNIVVHGVVFLCLSLRR